jgi:hypothetical protein
VALDTEVVRKFSAQEAVLAYEALVAFVTEVVTKLIAQLAVLA